MAPGTLGLLKSQDAKGDLKDLPRHPEIGEDGWVLGGVGQWVGGATAGVGLDVADIVWI